MSTPIAEQRLVSPDVYTESVASDGRSSGMPTAGAVLSAGGIAELGLWEASPGIDVDVEVDEVFLVLFGSGTVRFEDGSVLELEPGVLVRLVEGDRTTWQVSETLRKLYVA